MSKIKIDTPVRVISTGEVGVVKGRDVIAIDGSKHVRVEYIVKLGDGFSNWASFSKDNLEVIRKEDDELRVYTKEYDVVDGYKIMMYAKVDNFSVISLRFGVREMGRTLKIGYSIYSPSDEYNENIGIKIARKRSRTRPFCTMSSNFKGEFNADTVNAIMDVKASYIKNNFDKFINKKQ